MRLEYDLNVGALYIVLADEPVADTVEVGGNAVVDLDASGEVVGVEVISAAHPWPLAQILALYPIADADAAQLRAYFMPTVLAPMQRADQRLPVMEAEPTAPTAPTRILVPA